jgi:poly(3-hydroxyalkanoate) synthetase
MKIKISITLDEDVILWLKEQAELSDRSISQYINILLKNRMKRDKK